MESDVKVRLFKVGYFIIIFLAILVEYLILKKLFPDLEENRPSPLYFYVGLFAGILQFSIMLLLFIFIYIKISKKALGRDFVRANIASGESGIKLTRGLERLVQKWIDS